MKVIHDYLLVKEIIENNKLEGTNLTIAYDDTERFMTVEIVETSEELVAEYSKYYPKLDINDLRRFTKMFYQPGTKLIINRVAKTPYKDGLFFISFKDVIAVESLVEENKEDSKVEQLTLFDY